MRKFERALSWATLIVDAALVVVNVRRLAKRR